MIELLINLFFDIVQVTLKAIEKISYHIIIMVLVIMTASTLSGNKVNVGEFVGFQFGDTPTNQDDIAQTTPQQFSTQFTDGDFRIPYDTYSGGGGLHGLSGWEGVDIVGGCGAEIYAPISGIIDKTGNDGYLGPYSNGEYNTWVGISNTEYSTVLLHGDYLPSFGDTVEQGQLIGYENSIGNSTGCHSHWIMYRNGTVFNGLQ